METAPHSTCAHEACRCTKPYDQENQAGGTRYVDPEAQYCSARCEESAGLPGTLGAHCECGHPMCAPQQTIDIPPMQ
jgi:hypothetical protein